MRNFALNLIRFSYERIFHEKMGDDARGFIKNLSYIVVASGIAAILSTIFNIFAGRTLGPSEYGEFTLIQTIAMFLIVPMMLGFDIAMIKHTAEKNEFEIQSSIISTAFILVLVFTLISISIYYLFSLQISNIFSVSTDILYLAIIFAVISVISTFATGTLRGLHKMKEYATFQPLPNIILILVFSVFFFIDFISFKSALISMYLSLGITGLIMLYVVHKYLKLDFKTYWAKKLIRYGSYASLGGLSSVFYGNIDKIIIYKYLTAADTGIYRAYYFASINLVGLFIGMFIAIFFPLVCKYKDKNVILSRTNKIVLYIIIFGLPLIIFPEFIILKLYGSGYPFSLELAFFFGIGGILTCVNSIYSWLMSAIGTEGIKISTFAAIIMGLVDIFLNLWLVPLVGMVGAVIAIIISYIIGIGIVMINIKRHISNTH
jgi:O-antigen/teichoic acid export membrane protein